MRTPIVILSLVAVTAMLVSFMDREKRAGLREIYSRSPDAWPSPAVDAGVEWRELGVLPESPLLAYKDSLKHLIELGKTLFFDPRLSGSGTISCATCHQPELSWTDGKERSIGHAGAVNKRNSPTILNSWFYHQLFWDGRARDLEDQAFGPINSESEMNGDMRELPRLLRRIKGYATLFDSAYGDPGIDPDRIAHAIATFEETVVSRKSRFDEFLSGKKNALTNAELRGLHLFRTKARCMNCHYGPLMTDNKFHNSGFSGKDPGLYNVTHQDEDMGKFKTPSLRDVMKTGPWMHDGAISDMKVVIEKFNKAGMPGADVLLRPLRLSEREKSDLRAFLEAISAPPISMKRPVLPE